jgi:hypothetical protein
MIGLADVLDDNARLQRGLPVEDRSADLSKLLKFASNLSEPIHRWFKFKEAFSSQLVGHLLKEQQPRLRRTTTFLDPFCGVGTSLLAAEETLVDIGIKNVVLRGIEINPYLQFVAATKLDWHRYNPALMMRAAAVSTNGLRLRQAPSIPSLSTVNNEKFIAKRDLRLLLELRDKIRAATGTRLERRPLLLGLAAASERIFKLRKDGRALRFTPRDEKVSVYDEVAMRWTEIAEDLQLGRERQPTDYRVEIGDGRRADWLFAGQRFDVIMFSPPYLNNIDYTEVYKIELWLLGFLKSHAQMVAQRRRTFRSHPSCLFPQFEDARTAEVIEALGPSFKRLLEYASRAERWRGRLFAEYFADMLRTLRACRRLLVADGRIFLVIGNSVHGTADEPIPVATDVWTARLAHAAGLKVEKLIVGRYLPRRRISGSLLRESVIVMAKR